MARALPTGARRYAERLGRAMAQGLYAAGIHAQGLASQGMFAAPNRVRRVVSGSGIEYYSGRGAPLGGYPGVRTGTLERSLYVSVHPGPRGRSVVRLGASAAYAVYVHGRPETGYRRPFLALPFREQADELARVAVATVRREMAR